MMRSRATAREGAVPRGHVGAPPLNARRAPARARPRRAQAHRRRHGALRVMLKPQPAFARVAHRGRRPGQRVPARRLRPRRRRTRRAWASTRCGTTSVFERKAYVAGFCRRPCRRHPRALQDPDIAALIAVRGGYGSAQLLPLLDPAQVRAARKPFIGYSDITALLTFVTLQCGVVSFHGTDARGAPGPWRSRLRSRSFERALCSAEPMGEFDAPGVEVIAPGEFAGPARRRNGHAAAGFARNAVRLRSARRLRAVLRRGRGAAVSARSHGHPAATERSARQGRRGGHRRTAALRRAVGRGRRRVP